MGTRKSCCGHVLALTVLVVPGLVFAAPGGSELTLHLRSHYLSRDKSFASDSLAWGVGGWAAYRSSWLGDVMRIGLTAYTSQKLHGLADRDGAAVLAPGQRSYNVLGESYAAFRLGEQVLTAGRFVVNQYEVNPQDTRMTPRSFQGAALSGRMGDVGYFLGRIERMKIRNVEDFVPVATAAGAPPGSTEPMLLLSLRSPPAEGLNWGFASYRLRHLLASTYADLAWTTPLDTETKLRLGAQLLRQGSTGENRLTGAAFSTSTAGIKADLIRGPLTLSAIAMKTADGAAYRTPFGSWAGYASRIINNFNRAGERVGALDAVIDFTRLGVPGLLLNASSTVGRDAVNAATGAGLSANREHNLSVDYRFAQADWPAWAKPLWLRARAARFEQKLAGATDVTREYHLILNYELTFK